MLVSFAIIIQLLISLSLCQVQPGSKIDLTPGSYTVSGKIDNPSDRTITIISHEIFGRENHLTKVNEKGEFNLKVPILSPHDNMLMYDNQIIAFYAGKGDSIYLRASGDNFANSVIFSGNRMEINSTIHSSKKIYRSLYDSLQIFSFKVGNNDTDLFITRIDAFEKSLNKWLMEWDKHSLKVDERMWFESKFKYEIGDEIAEYKRRFEGGQLNDKYYSALNKYLQSEESDLNNSEYTEGFLNEYYERQLYRESSYSAYLSEGDPHSAILDYFETVDRLFTDTLSKDLLFTKVCITLISKGYDEVVSYMIDELSDKIHHKEFTDHILSILEKNNTSISSDNLSLSDLIALDEVGDIFSEIKINHPDKVLYIDLWGVWCKPCLQEFPYSEALFKDLKEQNFPIEFIYFGCTSKKEKWEGMIAKYNLNGTHYLLNNDQYNILSNKINLTGFPRYLIVDRKGNVNDNAKRPSQESLKKELVELAKM